MNLFRDLTPEEEAEFRKWARDNYDPHIMSISNLWHPVVVDECNKIYKEVYNTKSEG